MKQRATLLGQALDDPQRREAMARQAWSEVRDGRMFSNQVAARVDWYRDLWARREALNEAVMDRLPGLREAVERLRPLVGQGGGRL